jgi:hypothetical protein
MKPGHKALIIFLSGLGFYILTGDVSISFLLIILLSYFEFRKKGNHY